jgi:hypothetical protein
LGEWQARGTNDMAKMGEITAWLQAQMTRISLETAAQYNAAVAAAKK